MEIKILKRITGAAVSVLLTVILLTLNVFADEGITFLESSFSEDNKMSIYLTNVPSSISKIECLIGGNECEYISGNFVEGSGTKIQTVFFIDASQSITVEMREKINKFLVQMIDSKVSDDDEYAICTFTGKINYICEFESDRYNLEKAIENIKFTGEASYIYDGLKKIVNDISQSGEDCYKRIILITDGKENSANGSIYDDIRDVIKENMITIDSICVKDDNNLEKIKIVESFAGLTNGKSFRVTENTTIESIAGQIISEYRNIYKVDFSVPNAVLDGSIKNVRVNFTTPADTSSINYDLRMPMIKNETETVSESETVSEEITTTASVITEAQAPVVVVEQADNNDNMLIAVIIVAVLIFVICIAVIVCVMLSRKNNNNHIVQPAADISRNNENDKTEFLDGDSEGETLFLFSTNPIFRISLTDEKNPEKTYTANTSGNITIGRSREEASIVIDYDKSISKSHCRIFADGAKVYVQDLNSANKTFVNGCQVIDKDELTDGCVLKIGRVSFKVRITER